MDLAVHESVVGIEREPAYAEVARERAETSRQAVEIALEREGKAWARSDDLEAETRRLRQEIEELEKATADRPQAREAQRALAYEITALVHGPSAAGEAVAASQALFGRGSLDALSAVRLTP